MSLLSINEFQKRFSENSRPHKHTVRRWIERRLLPGLKIGGLYFVDEEALFAMGNPILEKVLRDVSRSA